MREIIDHWLRSDLLSCKTLLRAFIIFLKYLLFTTIKVSPWEMERQQLENKRNILSDISDISAPPDLPQLTNNFLCISGSWISISINQGQPRGLHHHLVSPGPRFVT